MAKTSTWDTFVWLKKIKLQLEANDEKTFTTDDIKDIFEIGYFNLSYRNEFIIEVDKVKIRKNKYSERRILWRINEHVIKSHKSRRAYFS